MSKEIPEYPVEITLKLIGHKQKILILRNLLTGTKRFDELKKSNGELWLYNECTERWKQSLYV